MHINNMKELAYTINKEFGKYEDVTYVGYYDDVVELLEELVTLDFCIVAADIKPEIYNGYNKEYYLHLCDGEIMVEKAFGKDDYLYNEASIIYINSDCNSSILKRLHGVIIEVDFDDEYEENGCESCEDRFECEDYLNELDANKDIHVNVNQNREIYRILIDKHGEDSCVHFEFESTKEVDDDFLDTILSYF